MQLRQKPTGLPLPTGASHATAHRGKPPRIQSTRAQAHARATHPKRKPKPLQEPAFAAALKAGGS